MKTMLASRSILKTLPWSKPYPLYVIENKSGSEQLQDWAGGQGRPVSAKPDNLSPILGTHMAGGEDRFPQGTLGPPDPHCGTRMSTYTTQKMSRNIIKNFKL